MLSKLVFKALNAGAVRAESYSTPRCPATPVVTRRKASTIGHRCDRRNGRGAVNRRAVQEGRAS